MAALFFYDSRHAGPVPGGDPRDADGREHDLEVYESNSKLMVRVVVDGDVTDPVTMSLTEEQSRELTANLQGAMDRPGWRRPVR